MRILVTGASGLLGISVALEAARDHEVFGVVNNTPLKTSSFKVFKADLLVPNTCQQLFDDIQPDWVIHCAALADIDACEADPAQARQLNTEIPAELALIVARGGARMLHVSTDAVFDGQKGDYTEQDAPNPLSVYARTKLDGERAVSDVNPEAIVARVNLYGWSTSGDRSLAEFFFNNLEAGKRLNGFDDVYFCPLNAVDLGQIFLRMLELNLNGLYHVVSSKCLTKYDFGVRIARIFGFNPDSIIPISVVDSSLNAPRSPRLTLRSDKLASQLGKKTPDINSGLQKFYSQYLQGYPKQIRGFVSD
jgi:dTDP-4-dehydrorhamnose reductase